MDNISAIRKNGIRLLILALLALPLIFLSGCTQPSQSPAPNSVEGQFTKYWTLGRATDFRHAPWFGIIIAALGLGLAMVAMSYMFGYMFHDEEAKAWAKKELMQIGFSVIILISISGVIASIGYYLPLFATYAPPTAEHGMEWKSYVIQRCSTPGMPPNLVLEDQWGAVLDMNDPEVAAAYDRPCHIRLAEDYLEILWQSSKGQALSMVRAYSSMSILSTFSRDSKGQADPAGVLSYSPFAGLSVPLEALMFTIDMTIKNMMTISFQQYFLEILHIALFPLFLMLGLFMRSMHFSRKTGGLLIAIALGLYIVYPLMLVFFHSVLYSLTGPWNAAMSSPELIGQNMIDYTIVGSTLDPMPIRSVNLGTGGYSPLCGDSKWDPGEECGEYSGAPNPASNNQPETRTCPPAGAGNEKKAICNHNSCKCTDNPNEAFGRFNKDAIEKNGFSAPSSLDAKDARIAQIKKSAELHMDIFDDGKMSDSQKNALDKQGMGWLEISQKSWLDKVLSGWGNVKSYATVSDSMLGFHGLFDNLAKLLVFTLIAPFISLMVALAAIKGLSPLLGGDVEIAGLTRLI